MITHVIICLQNRLPSIAPIVSIDLLQSYHSFQVREEIDVGSIELLIVKLVSKIWKTNISLRNAYTT